VAGGLLLNVLNRALSEQRLILATPYARRNHKLLTWAAEMAFGKSTITVVPYKGGVWDLWRTAFASSTGIKLATAGITGALAGVSLWDGVRHHGGVPGLVQSRSGRTGITTGSAAAITLYYMWRASQNAPKAAGAEKAVFTARLKSAFCDKSLGEFRVVKWALGAWALVGLNELGYFDFMDKGTHPSPSAAFHEATHRFAHGVDKSRHKIAHAWDKPAVRYGLIGAAALDVALVAVINHRLPAHLPPLD
jgi:hypothetical protein